MISETLSEIRRGRKLTMKDVAEGIGMKPDTYRNYESGRLEPNLSTLTKIADFYGVSTDYLLGRDTSEKPAIDLLAAQFDMSALEQEIIKGYLDLPENMRDNLMDFLERAVRKVQAGSIPTPMIARSSDDRPPGVMMLTPEQKKRLDEAPDETKNPDNDI